MWHDSLFLSPALSLNIVISHMTFTSQMIGWRKTKKKLVHILPGDLHQPNKYHWDEEECRRSSGILDLLGIRKSKRERAACAFVCFLHHYSTAHALLSVLLSVNAALVFPVYAVEETPFELFQHSLPQDTPVLHSGPLSSLSQHPFVFSANNTISMVCTCQDVGSLLWLGLWMSVCENLNTWPSQMNSPLRR